MEFCLLPSPTKLLFIGVMGVIIVPLCYEFVCLVSSVFG